MTWYKIILLFIILFVSSNSGAETTKEYSVNEETGKDAYIGNIPQDFKLPSLSSSDVPREYKILNGKDLVRINNVTGDLHTVTQLDREALCPENPSKCERDIEVVVFPKENIRFLKVILLIQDLNDNNPRFSKDPLHKEISESAAVGSMIRLDSAVDPDLEKNSIQNYRISSLPPGEENKSGTTVPCFELEVLENIDGTKIPQLRLTESLDREQVPSYQLLLYAVDGGSPALTGTATVLISVTDANDNQPVFEKENYIVKVKENEPPGYVVTTLIATDLDAGENAKIEYALSSSVSERERAIFKLNSSSGALSLHGEGLDYEKKKIHHLSVEAKDGGPDSSSAYASVTVQVQDVNDEQPEIEVEFVEDIERPEEQGSSDSQSKPVLVKENLAIGSFLAFVTVTDRDTGLNGNVSCRLKDSKTFEMETLSRIDNR